MRADDSVFPGVFEAGVNAVTGMCSNNLSPESADELLSLFAEDESAAVFDGADAKPSIYVVEFAL
jgi:hypothetical protein